MNAVHWCLRSSSWPKRLKAQLRGSSRNARSKARLHRPACATESSPLDEVDRERCWNLAGTLLGDWAAWTEPRCAQGLPTSCAVAAKLKPAVRRIVVGSVGRGNGAYRMTYAQPKSEPSSSLQLMRVGDPCGSSSAPHVPHEVFWPLVAQPSSCYPWA